MYQLSAQPLAQRVAPDQIPQFADEFARVAKGQIGLHALLHGGQLKLLFVLAEMAAAVSTWAAAEAVLGTARAAIRPFEGSGALPMTLRYELPAIGTGLRQLAATRTAWPRVVMDDLRAVAGRIVACARSEPVDLAAVVGSLLHTYALDLASVVGDDHP